MALAKLMIIAESAKGVFDDIFVALFNPNQISINKSANWRSTPTAESDTERSHFVHGDAATLTMDLFFDTYEQHLDVRLFTYKLFRLTTILSDLHRPPLCTLQWGLFNVSDDFQCRWILQSLNQRFTLFLPEGLPVRATVSCTFSQWRQGDDEKKIQKLQSADVAKQRTVKRGDTLSSIAGEEYNDPVLWRPIAEENNIDNPIVLEPGKVLAIPPLRSRPRAVR